MKILETDRLEIRELDFEDDEFIIRLTNSESWLKFIGNRNTKTKELAKIYIENIRKGYETNSFGLWKVVLKESQKPIGLSGILKRKNLENPDIAFAYFDDFAGKGYAHEAAISVLDFAKNHLKISMISAIVLPENTRSIRLIEKLGLNFIDKIRLETETEDLFLYQKTL